MRRAKSGHRKATKQAAEKRGGRDGDGSRVRGAKQGKESPPRRSLGTVPNPKGSRKRTADKPGEVAGAGRGERTRIPAADPGLVAAERVRTFFSHLKHQTGEYAGCPFNLADWQWRDIVRPFFGTLRADGLRQYRTMPIFMPRKNGKSTLCAGLGLYGLFGDGEPGAQVICAAGSRDQAAIVFECAANMVRSCPALASRCTVLRREIVHNNGGIFRCVAADAGLLHGLNCSMVIEDEIHVWPNRELHEALATSVVARRQPAVIQITTAGHDRDSFCYEVYARSKQILEARKAGQEIDATWCPVIYEASEEDDWQAEETWRKANPGYDVSVKRDYFVAKVNEARTSAAELNSFLRLHLNRWTDSETLWLNMDRWDECAIPAEEWPDLTGRPCYLGVDLSSTFDLSAIVAAFPVGDRVYLKSWAWTCSEAIADREKKNKIRFDKWANAGHLTICRGPQIDLRDVHAKVEELAKAHRICEIGIDRWGAAHFIQECQHAGHHIVGFGQGFAGISSAAKAFEAGVLTKRIIHDGNPLLRWCVSNTVIEEDAAGNIKPSKGASSEKIDLCVAAIMAHARAQLGQTGGTSIYESRGLASL